MSSAQPKIEPIELGPAAEFELRFAAIGAPAHTTGRLLATLGGNDPGTIQNWVLLHRAISGDVSKLVLDKIQGEIAALCLSSKEARAHLFAIARGEVEGIDRYGQRLAHTIASRLPGAGSVQVTEVKPPLPPIPDKGFEVLGPVVLSRIWLIRTEMDDFSSIGNKLANGGEAGGSILAIEQRVTLSSVLYSDAWRSATNAEIVSRMYAVSNEPPPGFPKYAKEIIERGSLSRPGSVNWSEHAEAVSGVSGPGKGHWYEPATRRLVALYCALEMETWRKGTRQEIEVAVARAAWSSDCSDLRELLVGAGHRLASATQGKVAAEIYRALRDESIVPVIGSVRQTQLQSPRSILEQRIAKIIDGTESSFEVFRAGFLALASLPDSSGVEDKAETYGALLALHEVLGDDARVDHALRILLERIIEWARTKEKTVSALNAMAGGEDTLIAEFAHTILRQVVGSGPVVQPGPANRSDAARGDTSTDVSRSSDTGSNRGSEASSRSSNPSPSSAGNSNSAAGADASAGLSNADAARNKGSDPASMLHVLASFEEAIRGGKISATFNTDVVQVCHGISLAAEKLDPLPFIDQLVKLGATANSTGRLREAVAVVNCIKEIALKSPKGDEALVDTLVKFSSAGASQSAAGQVASIALLSTFENFEAKITAAVSERADKNADALLLLHGTLCSGEPLPRLVSPAIDTETTRVKLAKLVASFEQGRNWIISSFNFKGTELTIQQSGLLSDLLRVYGGDASLDDFMLYVADMAMNRAPVLAAIKAIPDSNSTDVFDEALREGARKLRKEYGSDFSSGGANKTLLNNAELAAALEKLNEGLEGNTNPVSSAGSNVLSSLLAKPNSVDAGLAIRSLALYFSRTEAGPGGPHVAIMEALDAVIVSGNGAVEAIATALDPTDNSSQVAENAYPEMAVALVRSMATQGGKYLKDKFKDPDRTARGLFNAAFLLADREQLGEAGKFVPKDLALQRCAIVETLVSRDEFIPQVKQAMTVRLEGTGDVDKRVPEVVDDLIAIWTRTKSRAIAQLVVELMKTPQWKKCELLLPPGPKSQGMVFTIVRSLLQPAPAPAVP